MAEVGDSAIRVVKDAMFPDTATGADLDRLGSMFMIKRHEALGTDETKYREMVQLLAFQPKQVLRIVYQFLEILFDSQADIEAASKRPWRVYEPVCNEILVEIPYHLTAASNANATYLHGLGSDLGYTLAANNELKVVGENMSQVASSLVGLTLKTIISGVITAYTISGHTYDTTTRVNTFTVAPGTLPLNTNGLTWRVEVPATSSFTGDYFVLNASVNGATQVNSEIVVLYGEALIEMFVEFMDLLVKASGVVVRIERI